MVLRMPGEWTRHERTLLGWPCREAMWGPLIEAARAETAAVANAIAEFEPVTMVCASDVHAKAAGEWLTHGVEIVVLPMDGSWMRDNGPVYVTGDGRREARHFRYNAYGEYHAKRDRDARLGATLARHYGDDVTSVDVTLEGGALATDGNGTLAVTETCLLDPDRNWYLNREEVEDGLKAALGMTRVLWLPGGLVQDLGPGHTNGHTDLFLVFLPGRRCLLAAPMGDDDPNTEVLTEDRRLLTEAGYDVVDVPFLPQFDHDGQPIAAPYLNLYLANDAVLIPVTGADPDMDDAALALIGSALSAHTVVPVPMRAHPVMGGAIHCITQQMPATG